MDTCKQPMGAQLWEEWEDPQVLMQVSEDAAHF